MKKVPAAGILLFSKKKKYFLLMKHPRRFDLPKGHLENNENYIEGALREFNEETGISKKNIKLFSDFKFSETYFPFDKKYGNQRIEKHLVIYIAKLKISRKKAQIKLTEHIGYEWVKWDPPHSIYKHTIDPLLKKAEIYFSNESSK